MHAIIDDLFEEYITGCGQILLTHSQGLLLGPGFLPSQCVHGAQRNLLKTCPVRHPYRAFHGRVHGACQLLAILHPASQQLTFSERPFHPPPSSMALRSSGARMAGQEVVHGSTGEQDRTTPSLS